MYIGVTGFTDHAQVRNALQCVPPDMIHPLMVGVLASYKTIRGKRAQNPNRYPRREDIGDIFDGGWMALNLVHYNTPEPAELAAQLWGALEWGGPYCEGLQLNIVWPDPAVVHGLRISRQGVKIVLQINRPAMIQCRNSAGQVARRVGEFYGNDVDYVLVDASGGKGVPLIPEEAAAYLVELDRERERRGQKFSLLVAGGLSAENLQELLTPVRMHVPDIGFDAEGALRTDDELDRGKVQNYIRAAYQFQTQRA